jgi:hypothetical protein
LSTGTGTPATFQDSLALLPWALWHSDSGCFISKQRLLYFEAAVVRLKFDVPRDSATGNDAAIEGPGLGLREATLNGEAEIPSQGQLRRGVYVLTTSPTARAATWFDG